MFNLDKKLSAVTSHSAKGQTASAPPKPIATTSNTKEENEAIKSIQALAKSQNPWAKFQLGDYDSSVVSALIDDSAPPKGVHTIDPSKGIAREDFSVLSSIDPTAYVVLNKCAAAPQEALDVFNNMLESMGEQDIDIFTHLANLCTAVRLTQKTNLPLIPNNGMAAFLGYKTSRRDLSFFHVAPVKGFHEDDPVLFVDSDNNDLTIDVMSDGKFEWVDFTGDEYVPHKQDDPATQEKLDEFAVNSFIHARVQASGIFPSLSAAKKVDIDTTELIAAVEKQDTVIASLVNDELFDIYVEKRDAVLEQVTGTYDFNNAPRVNKPKEFAKVLNAVRASAVATVRDLADVDHPMSSDELVAFRKDRGLLGQSFKEYRSMGSLIASDEGHSVIAKWHSSFVEASKVKLPLEKAVAYGHSKANHWQPLLNNFKIEGHQGDILKATEDADNTEVLGLVSDVWLIQGTGEAPIAAEDDPSEYTQAGLKRQAIVYKEYLKWLNRREDAFVIVKMHPYPMDSASGMTYLGLSLFEDKFVHIGDAGLCRSHNGERIFIITNKQLADDYYPINDNVVSLLSSVLLTEAYYSNMLRNVALYTGFPILSPGGKIKRVDCKGPVSVPFSFPPDYRKYVNVLAESSDSGGGGTVNSMKNATAFNKALDQVTASVENKSNATKKKGGAKAVPGAFVVVPKKRKTYAANKVNLGKK